MKKLIAKISPAALALSILSLLSTTAQSRSLAAVNEEMCLDLSSVAEKYAEIKDKGYSLSFINNALDKGQVGKSKDALKVTNSMRQVASYVYVMNLNIKDAGKLVYMKCKAGEYE